MEVRRVLQPFLILANAFVLLCGLAVVSVGVWALLTEREYSSILEKGDTQVTRIPTSIIVAGIFVCVLAMLGLLGTVLAKTYLGKTLLGMYAFVLFLIIIMEIGCGSAAVRYREDLEKAFTDSTTASQRNAYCRANQTWDAVCDKNTYDEDWDEFQQKHHCCGSTGYESYNHSTLCPQHEHPITNNTNVTGAIDILVADEPLTVPPSCCNLAKLHASPTTCFEVSCNVTSRNVEYIYQQGCSPAAIRTLRQHQVVIAVTTFLIGIAQIVGVISASVTMYLEDREEGARERKYTRLKQLTMTTTLSTTVQ